MAMRNGQLIAALVSGLTLVAAQAMAADAAKAIPGADKKAQQTASAPQVAKLSAEQIVERYVGARGGVQAWKALQTLQLSGKIDAGKPDAVARSQQVSRTNRKLAAKGPAEAEQAAEQQVQLPFRLDVKRPHKTRLEIEFAGKTAVQVYDGVNGWKLRPFLNRAEAEPFTKEEARTEAANDGIEGPLFDYAAKGTKVVLEKIEAVEGSPAYKLKLTKKDGTTRQVWIDAKTFLDVKVQGVPRRMDGKMHEVFVYQRDFRAVQGVVIPHMLETAVEGYPDRHRMVIEKVAVNPQLDDARFAKPHA
jgi:outer membrane lipoprotein-sorting protein